MSCGEEKLLNLLIEKIKGNRMAYYFILPALITIMVLTIYPVLYTFYLSFFDYNIIFAHLKRFLSLGNYLNLLTSSFFWEVMINTVLFTVFCVVMIMIIGFFVAL